METVAINMDTNEVAVEIENPGSPPACPLVFADGSPGEVAATAMTKAAGEKYGALVADYFFISKVMDDIVIKLAMVAGSNSPQILRQIAAQAAIRTLADLRSRLMTAFAAAVKGIKEDAPEQEVSDTIEAFFKDAVEYLNEYERVVGQYDREGNVKIPPVANDAVEAPQGVV